jgi:hypothetical protein
MSSVVNGSAIRKPPQRLTKSHADVTPMPFIQGRTGEHRTRSPYGRLLSSPSCRSCPKLSLRSLRFIRRGADSKEFRSGHRFPRCHRFLGGVLLRESWSCAEDRGQGNEVASNQLRSGLRQSWPEGVARPLRVDVAGAWYDVMNRFAFSGVHWRLKQGVTSSAHER